MTNISPRTATFPQPTDLDILRVALKNPASGEPGLLKNGLTLLPLHEIWVASAPQSPSLQARAMAETS